MEFGHHEHRYSSFPHHQCHSRNMALAYPSGSRTAARVYPMNRPQTGGRDDDSENANRKRVAVACARCRKRKIRCSGDPGDGNGCENCKAAGVNPVHCAFHRVGSGEAASMIDLHNNLSNIANSQGMQIYSTPMASLRPRPMSYPQLDTKSAYPHTWTVPYSEETSPVETYGLDQPAAYLPTQGTVTYGDNYCYSNDSKPTPNGYVGHESAIYAAHGYSYMPNNIRSVASSDALSNSMTSLQLTQMPHTHHGLPVSHRPQLPIPQPSPAQTSRNVVDRLQDQRLRSTQAMGRSSLSNGGFARAAFPYSAESEVQVTATTDNSALAAQVSMPNSISTMGSATCYASASVADEIPVSSASQINFSTSSLFDATPAPTLQPTYSNFRDYKLPTSSSADSMTSVTRPYSQTDLYTIGSSSKDLSGGGSTLVSGHAYTPLSHSQSQPQHQAGQNNLSQGNRTATIQRSSPILNRSY